MNVVISDFYVSHWHIVWMSSVTTPMMHSMNDRIHPKCSSPLLVVMTKSLSIVAVWAVVVLRYLLLHLLVVMMVLIVWTIRHFFEILLMFH